MMLSIELILAAIFTLSISGLPACMLSRLSGTGQRVTTGLMLIGSVLGLCGIVMSLREATAPSLRVAWFLPYGSFAVSVDALSAMFLAPVFIVPALGSIYGLEYWKQSEHPDNGRWLGVFYGLMAGSIALVMIARDGILFLMAWEIMALAVYFAVITEEDKQEVRRAGWVNLLATHTGVLVMFASFALWRHATGSFALEPAQTMGADLANAIFVTAVVGFSFKAGLFPLHFWLPGAHACVPSHLSAIMSGVLLKTGIYGIARISSLLPLPPAWWGGTLLAVGAVSGVFGIAFAMSQHDFKRLLAYSSVENIGIIAMGLGLALLGRSAGRTDLMLLGLSGCILHVWNHSLFKSLLFLNSGAILHAVHTREMDLLGGLGKRMPITMGLFAWGAIAICALPPLNGFVSEWLIYIGLFRTLIGTQGQESLGFPGAAVGAVALAAIGALALACFVKMFGAVFLGSPRSEAGKNAHDPGGRMIGPMAVLAGGCAVLGLFPLLAAPLLERATRTWAALPASGTSGGESLTISSLAPLHWITTLGLALIALTGAIFLAMKLLPRRGVVSRGLTWDCGYARPTARMQYTGSSFTQTLLNLTGWIVWPRVLRHAIEGVFAAASRFQIESPDLVLDRGLNPGAEGVVQLLPWVRRFQQGNLHLYLLYVLLTVVFLFLLGS